jgi:hypothetical protein
MPLPPPNERLGVDHRSEHLTVAGLRWRFAIAMALAAAAFLLVVAALAALT